MATPVSRSGQPRFLAIAALLAAIVLFRPAHAQTPASEFWGMPDSAIAFVTIDPRPLSATPDPNYLLVQAGLRALIENVLSVEGGGAPIPGDLLAPGILGANPFRICVLDLSANLPSGAIVADRRVKLTKATLIVEVRAKAPHDDLLEVLRGIVSRDHTARQAPPVTESLADLPNGRKATTLVAPGEEEWREVTSCSLPDSFLIGLGHGALERWFAAPAPAIDKLSEWNRIRTEVFQRHASAVTVLDAGVDLDALRRLLPEQFASGRLGRLVQAWHVSNARTLMLLARLTKPDKDSDAAPLLCVDLGWSSRSQPPGTIHSSPLSEAAWPEGINLLRPPTETKYALVVRSAWAEWIPMALDTWAALTPRANSAPLLARLKWMRAHSKALDRLTDRAGPWVQVCGSNPSVPPFVSSFDAPPATGDTLDGDLREVFGTLSDAIKAEPAKRIWTLTLDDAPAPLNRFGWVAPRQSRLLMGSWDPAALVPAKPPR